MCEKCRHKSVGCQKFCSTYKSEYDRYIEAIKLQMRVQQREQEIIERMKYRK